MTIDLAPLLPSRRGTAERPLQPSGAKASLPRAERHRGSIWVPNTQTCCLWANCFICV